MSRCPCTDLKWHRVSAFTLNRTIRAVRGPSTNNDDACAPKQNQLHLHSMFAHQRTSARVKQVKGEKMAADGRIADVIRIHPHFLQPPFILCRQQLPESGTCTFPPVLVRRSCRPPLCRVATPTPTIPIRSTCSSCATHLLTTRF